MSGFQSFLPYASRESHTMQMETSWGTVTILRGGPIDGKPMLVVQTVDSVQSGHLLELSEQLIGYQFFALEMPSIDESLSVRIAEIMDCLHLETCSFICPAYAAGIFHIKGRGSISDA